MDRVKTPTDSRQHYILHYLFLMPQEKQATSKQTAATPAQKAALFLLSL